MELSNRNQVQKVYGQNDHVLAKNQYDQKLQQAEAQTTCLAIEVGMQGA